MHYTLTVFYDYICPFSNLIVKWLEKIEQSGKIDLTVNWKALPLEQVNNAQGEGFKIWEHPEFPSRSIPALAAAKAALKQGPPLFTKFHRLIFKAYHEQAKDISKKAMLLQTASEAGLDLEVFRKEMDLEENRQAIGDDYLEAKQSYNLFGVPSLVFENDEPLFVKIESVPETEEESLKLFEHIFQMGLEMPYLLELKRP